MGDPLAESLARFRNAGNPEASTPILKDVSPVQVPLQEVPDLSSLKDKETTIERLDQTSSSETVQVKPKGINIVPPPVQGAQPKPVPPLQETFKATEREKDNVMVQGSTYEEEDTNGTRLEESDSNVGSTMDEDLPSKRNSIDFSNPKAKMILVGAIIGIIILIAVIILASVNSKKKAEAEALAKAQAYEDSLNEEEQVFKYTSDEIYQLRLNGYTGDEIEQNELDAVPAQVLIDEAQAAADAKLKAEILPYFDAASDEFKTLYNDTWIGGDDLTYDGNKESFQYLNQTLNVDYKKLPPKGYQLFIEFWLPNGKACFTTMDPVRWAELPDSGNIVLSMNYIETADGKQIITDISEVINK